MAEIRTRVTQETTLREISDRLNRVETAATRFADQPLPWELANQFITVNSATFVPIAHVEMPRYDGDVLNTRTVVVCDSGTSGELRIRQEITGATTDVAAVGPGVVQNYVDFEWIHGIHLSDTYEHFIYEARRTAGAGNLTVYYPRRSIISTRLRFPNADTAGNPTVI